MYNGNPYRSAGGNRYTQALFWEMVDDKSTVVYTLKDRDHQGFPSLYRLYMAENDPLEWAFSQKYLDGWEHWEMLSASGFFKPYITRWRYELELKLRSEALARAMVDAQSGSKTAQMSNKLLIQRGWSIEKNTKGRPSKADIKREANRLAETNRVFEEDLNRILPSGVGVQ